jgi:hypothetical protein
MKGERSSISGASDRMHTSIDLWLASNQLYSAKTPDAHHCRLLSLHMGLRTDATTVHQLTSINLEGIAAQQNIKCFHAMLVVAP